MSERSFADLAAAKASNLARRLPIEALARTMVEVPRNLRDALPGERAQDRSLRHETSDEAVRVLARAALPRVVRLGEEDTDAEFFLNIFPKCELTATIIRDRERWQFLEALHHTSGDHIGVAGGNKISDHEATLPFDVHEEACAIGSDKRAVIAWAKPRRAAISRSTITPPSDDRRPASNVAVSGLPATGDRPGKIGVAFMAMGGGSSGDAHELLRHQIPTPAHAPALVHNLPRMRPFEFS